MVEDGLYAGLFNFQFELIEGRQRLVAIVDDGEFVSEGNGVFEQWRCCCISRIAGSYRIVLELLGVISYHYFQQLRVPIVTT